MTNLKNPAFLIIRIAFICLLWVFSVSVARAKNPYYKTIYIIKGMNTYVKFIGAKLVSIDVGGSSGDLIWAADATGVVKFRAVKTNFKPTNMLVTTKDTSVQFLVQYGSKGERLVNVDLSFGGRFSGEESKMAREKKLAEKKKDTLQELLKKKPYNEAEMIVESDMNPSNYLGDFQPQSFPLVRITKRAVKNVNFGDGYGVFSLVNFQQDKDFFYFTLGLDNRSKIEFPIGNVSFEVKGLKPAKKNVTDQSIFARYVPDSLNAKVVYPGERKKIIFSTRKFALRADEELHIKIYEKSINSKGRSYEMIIRQRVFNKSLQNF